MAKKPRKKFHKNMAIGEIAAELSRSRAEVAELQHKIAELRRWRRFEYEVTVSSMWIDIGQLERKIKSICDDHSCDHSCDVGWQQFEELKSNVNRLLMATRGYGGL